ncbi:uncharacterized protein LOC587999 [Strongylocentrotus purpuratus]|uniref:Uncharacterized protein n=1 Tax=Strongylocentrotus purpuratus TaxID=7668 RepID=A0A7M7RDQ2_STRPU|nr:uncharacterized protein LOC587999 [Strongylocentrotus purpuratus]|eukprot:XP_792794.4 PREDICTED: uncharacterized protein LOC587999 [Strongylocentrotus purpuratus]
MDAAASSGDMKRNMAAVNQMAVDMIVNQRALPYPRGNRSIRPNGRKYNSYTPEMRTRIAKYAMVAGDLETAQHFSRELGHKVAVTSVWRFRKAYTRELKWLHQEGVIYQPNSYSAGDRRQGGVHRRVGGRSRGVDIADAVTVQQGRGEQMDMGADCDWTPPTEAEMKVIQAKKERSDKISKLMGDYLLKGYRMLATTCTHCGTILLRDKQQKDYCVTCSELATEHAKDDPALSAEAARSQVREQELVRASPSSSSGTGGVSAQNTDDMPFTITNVCSGPEALGNHQLQGATSATAQRIQLQSSPSPAPPPTNPQATVLPQTAGSLMNNTQHAPATTTMGAPGGARTCGDRNTRVELVIGQSLDSVLDKLTWASAELRKSTSVESCTQLCRLIQACADAADSLKGSNQN